MMHKAFLISVALFLLVIAVRVPSALSLMACGLLAVVMVAVYFGMYARLEPRAREHPQNVALFRTFSIGALVGTLVTYALVLPVALHILTGVTLFVGFALMAATTGFCCGGVACAIRLERTIGYSQHG